MYCLTNFKQLTNKRQQRRAAYAIARKEGIKHPKLAVAFCRLIERGTSIFEHEVCVLALTLFSFALPFSIFMFAMFDDMHIILHIMLAAWLASCVSASIMLVICTPLFVYTSRWFDKFSDRCFDLLQTIDRINGGTLHSDDA